MLDSMKPLVAPLLERQNCKPIILLAFPTVFQEVSFIHGGLIDELSLKGYKTVIVVEQDADKKKLSNYFSSHPNITIERAKLSEKPLLNFISGFLTWKNINNMSFCAQQRNQKIFIFKKLFFKLGAILLPKTFLGWAENNCLSLPACDKLVLKYKPNIILLSDAGNLGINRYLARSAKKYNIPVIAAEECIDDAEIASRLPILDKACVWGQDMKDELMRYHKYPRKNISITGLPRGDIYFNENFIKTREAIFKECGLDSRKKLITIATTTSNPQFFCKITKLLLDADQSGKFPFPIQIYLRITPYQKKEYYSIFQGNPRVYLGEPFYIRSNEVISKEQVSHLVGLLHATDIFINILSTMTLEACLLDKPIINIGFDEVDKIFEFSYAKRIIGTGGTSFVHNPQELLAAINNYFNDPLLHKEKRQELVEKFCFKNDGKATKRIMAVIGGILS